MKHLPLYCFIKGLNVSFEVRILEKNSIKCQCNKNVVLAWLIEYPIQHVSNQCATTVKEKRIRLFWGNVYSVVKVSSVLAWHPLRAAVYPQSSSITICTFAFATHAVAQEIAQENLDKLPRRKKCTVWGLPG